MVDSVYFPRMNSLARKYALQGLAERGITGIAVGTQLPSPMQNRFIRLYAIVGREICRRTQSCQIIGFVYDTKGNDVRCEDLAYTLGDVLRSAPDMVVDGEQWISEPCEKHGPFPSEDPDLPGIPRYQVNLVWTVQSTVSAET